MAYVKFYTGKQDEAVIIGNRMLDLARNLGDPDALWVSSALWLYFATAPQHAGERLRLAEELLASSRPILFHQSLSAGLTEAGFAFLDGGQRQRAEETWHEMHELAERTGQVNLLITSAAADDISATVDGRLEEAEETARGIMTRGEEMGITSFATGYALAAGYRSWLLLGKADEALQLVTTSVPLLPAEALCLAHLGRNTEAAEILERSVINRSGIGSAEDETPAMDDILYLEAAVLVEHRKAAELLLNRFAGSYSPLVSYITITCTARHLGAAAALLNRPDEARKYYQEALKVTTEVRFRPEIAITRLQLAELLFKHYPDEKTEAKEHLDFAIKEFREMKMQPSLERALRHKDILKA
jgi:tetratricopeptide (TPR) repeat protein